MLFVKIISLDNATQKSDWFSKNDIYVKINYGEQSRRTTTKWDENNPQWNESFLFDKNEKINTLTLELYDSDKWSSDEVLEKYSYKINYKNTQTKKIKIGKLLIELGDLFASHNDKIKTLSKRCKKYEKNCQLLNKVKELINTTK